MDYSQMMRMGGGALGGFGQGMMDQGMRRTYGTARSGGYQDLMEDRQLGDFVTGDNTQNLMRRFQELRGKMIPAQRGMYPATSAPGQVQ